MHLLCETLKTFGTAFIWLLACIGAMYSYVNLATVKQCEEENKTKCHTVLVGQPMEELGSE